MLEAADFIMYCTLKPEYKHFTFGDMRKYSSCLETISLPRDKAPERIKEYFRNLK